MSHGLTSTSRRRYEEMCLLEFAQRQKNNDFYVFIKTILSAPKPVTNTLFEFLKYKIEFIKENNGIESVKRAYNNALEAQRKKRNAKNRQSVFDEFKRIIESHFQGVMLKSFNQLDMF